MANDLASKLGDGPGLIVAKPTTANITVSREGLVVLLQIGSSVVRMKYQDAMQIGHWLTVRAFECKMADNNQQRILMEPERHRPKQ